MSRLVLASAGAGKSRLIVNCSYKEAKAGKSVLIITYTRNNQQELINRVCSVDGCKPVNLTVKGWFTFLLEDMIRPYQRCIFKDRVAGINFNSKNPHKNSQGRNIPGTAEKIDGKFNSVHFFTKHNSKAHTINLAKLAFRVIKKSKNSPIVRLKEIYDEIYIDEVQDLVGYDYEIIRAIFKSFSGNFSCVGDFRQTIYSTSISSKLPQDNKTKIEKFKDIGFISEHMNISWRCIQPICDFADLVHAREGCYLPTSSKVEKIPHEYSDHLGVFAVHSNLISNYINHYNPVILRVNRNTKNEICAGQTSFNFGEVKGLGFKRVLILSTEKQQNFLAGDMTVFDEDKTEKARNTFYVAITRAKYSVAIVSDGENLCGGVNEWTKHQP